MDFWDTFQLQNKALHITEVCSLWPWKWFKRILTRVWVQKVTYPSFLLPPPSFLSALTQMWHQRVRKKPRVKERLKEFHRGKLEAGIQRLSSNCCSLYWKAESQASFLLEVLGLVFFTSKVAFSWPFVYRIGKNFWGRMTLEVKLKVYQLCANLDHRELRNATFEGKTHLT